jgi:tRNA(Ile2) C34 agmatinyltransferase TiaS
MIEIEKTNEEKKEGVPTCPFCGTKMNSIGKHLAPAMCVQSENKEEICLVKSHVWLYFDEFQCSSCGFTPKFRSENLQHYINIH